MPELHPPSLVRALLWRQPVLWVNPHWRAMTGARFGGRLGLSTVEATERQLQQFAPLLIRLFPELQDSGGIIESALYPADGLQRTLARSANVTGRWLLKADHALPIAGSIKARGAFYEVLLHAYQVAHAAGLIEPDGDMTTLASPVTRALFGAHEISVGSTGNLGLAVGILAAALGFKATVHMSVEAKAWKKTRLRARGVEVIEHSGDFGEAVAAGRRQAEAIRNTYFVDDEQSMALFLGYSVAALRLKPQLEQLGVTVDEDHPLFVYLPCGVGGSPGGITFGLRHVFGDHVHCFFAEPTACPGMLVRLASSSDQPPTLKDLGLNARTEADGLAVAKPSELVASLVHSLVSGIFTVSDEDLFEDLYHLEVTERMQIEPSAAAGFRGPRWLLESDAGAAYLANHGLSAERATHLLWTTGGALVPAEEYRGFHERGKGIARNQWI